MMMPANYSVVAENEMTYVVGGGIADILAPMMTAKNVQNIVVNAINAVGSFFASNVIYNGLSQVFSFGFTSKDSYTSDGMFLPVEFGDGKDAWASLGNLALNIVGMASAIYAMGYDVTGPDLPGKLTKVEVKA